MSKTNIFEQDMLLKYKALLEQAAGLKSVTVDGQVTSFEDLESKYAYWRERLARRSRPRRRVLSIDLSSF